MTALDPAVALPTLAHRHAKFVEDETLHREIFLILRDAAPPDHGSAAVGTRRRQRCVVAHIHARRRRPMGRAAVGGARLAARSLRALLRHASRKGCGLAVGPAPRHLELLFQPLVLAPQSVAFDLRAQQILAQPLDLARLVVHDLSWIRGRRGILRAPRHGTVMPDFSTRYKREILGASVPRCVVGAERISRVLTR